MELSDDLWAQLDALIESDTDGLLDLPDKPLPPTETDRLKRAFREVVDFVEREGREPDPATLDIAERKLGARLVGIRASSHKMGALRDMDSAGLFEEVKAPSSVDDLLTGDLDDLLADPTGILDTSRLPKRDSPVKDPDRAVREKCVDFELFEPLFKEKHAQLAAGDFAMTQYRGLHTVKPGEFFVLQGMMAFIAEVGESEIVNLKDKNARKERLRVIFENGTESAMYRQSFGVRMGEMGGFAVTRTGFDATEIGDADTETGHLYVLRSLSTNPDIASLPNLYKIGFSTTPVAKRIKGAERSATYLMAPVELVADYRLYNVRPSALEHLIHKLFAAARLDASVAQSTGKPVAATEWFLVPLPVIDRAVELVANGQITNYFYDPAVQDLVEVDR